MQYTSSAMGEKMLILVGAAAFTVLATIALLFSIKAGIVLFFGGLLVAVVFIKPFWGLLIYLAMIYLRPQEFVPALRAKPIMLILAIIVLVTLLLHNALRKKRLLALDLRQGIFMIAFFVIIILSQLQRFYIGGARMAFDSFLPVFILFFMIINLVTSFAEMKRTYLLLLVMTVFLAANGILQYHRGFDIAGERMFEGRIRWIGIFEDPNDLGLAILAFTPFALLKLARKGGTVSSRIGYLLVLGILLYALYLTNSRGTFIGLLVVFAYLSCRTWGAVRGLAATAVLGAAVFIAGPSRLADLSRSEASASGRIDAWAQGLGLLKWRPILGVGYGSFTEYHALTAHNSIVLCMAELGLVGLYVWLLLIATSFQEMIVLERRAQEGEYAFYARTMQLSMVGFFTAAFFLSRTYNEVLYIILALCTVLSSFGREQFEYRIPFLSRNTAISVVFITAGLIALIKILVIV
ncbi:MAG: O-antigen ligase family protein [Candidatus Krumholzibacteria bacterium]|nr:O-antigen ligase family protein [Candidatus Krumholzibacteria bacterium]